jgi:hypothetical protein
VHKILIDDEKSWRGQAVANLEFATTTLKKIERSLWRVGLGRLCRPLREVLEALALTKYLLVHPMPEVGGDDGGERQSPDQVVPRLRVVAGGSGSIGLPKARPSGNFA